jgi:hypothetical protein
MIGAPAGIAVVLVAVAVTLHHHNQKKRTFWVIEVVSLLFTVAAFFAVLAFTPSLGAVWAYTGDGPGLVVLLVAVAASGIAYYHHLRHRENFHTHGTPAIGVILAASAALVILNIRHVSGHALGAVAGSWHGAGTAFNEVNAGKVSEAPATVTTGTHGVILAVAIIIGLLLVVKVARSAGGRHKAAGRPPAGPGARELGR